MRLLVLGATGLTGGELLSQGLEQGHDVTALVRNPAKLALAHERLRVTVGNATDATAVDEAVEGQAAVLCALGTRSLRSIFSSDLMRASMRVLMPAMERRDVSRLILLSALGVGRSAEQTPVALRIAFRSLLRQVGRDKAAAEEDLRTSDLDWTIVYPPTLTTGPRTTDYRSGEVLQLKGIPRISRADVAHFMLSQLTSSSYSRRTAIISS
jgi:putative NADH-flavin reductase